MGNCIRDRRNGRAKPPYDAPVAISELKRCNMLRTYVLMVLTEGEKVRRQFGGRLEPMEWNSSQNW